jgi:hypothetical protein
VYRGLLQRSIILVGAGHTLTNIRQNEDENPKAYPAFKYMGENPSIAATPKSVIDEGLLPCATACLV